MNIRKTSISSQCFEIHWFGVPGWSLGFKFCSQQMIVYPLFQIRVDEQFNPNSDVTLKAPPSAHSSVSLNPVKYTLTESRRRNRCRDDVSREVIKFPYSDKTCRYECFDRYTLKICDCSPVIPREFMVHPDNYTICQASHQLLCMVNRKKCCLFMIWSVIFSSRFRTNTWMSCVNVLLCAKANVNISTSIQP